MGVSVGVSTDEGASMSQLTGNQPEGTPTWVELTVPDIGRAAAFYHAVFDWDLDSNLIFRLNGRTVAGLKEGAAEKYWAMYFATGNCDAAAKRVIAEGGTLHEGPAEFGDRCRRALAEDPAGARFGLWQGRGSLGCELVNEPGTLVRNDLATPEPEPARAFYAALFDFTLDGNPTLPDFDFTFLRRRDGHQIGGIFGAPETPAAAWMTTFEVADADETVRRASDAGARTTTPEDSPYGRIATVTDPFGTEFTVINRPR
jgi:uncharacterized protein